MYQNFKTPTFFYKLSFVGGLQNNCPKAAPPANENANRNINITIKVPII